MYIVNFLFLTILNVICRSYLFNVYAVFLALRLILKTNCILRNLSIATVVFFTPVLAFYSGLSVIIREITFFTRVVHSVFYYQFFNHMGLCITLDLLLIIFVLQVLKFSPSLLCRCKYSSRSMDRRLLCSIVPFFPFSLPPYSYLDLYIIPTFYCIV